MKVAVNPFLRALMTLFCTLMACSASQWRPTAVAYAYPTYLQYSTMTEKKRCRVATKSRHFIPKTPPARASITSGTSSKHFLHAPSSPIGSMRSLPNFLITLVPTIGEECVREKGTRFCSCERLAEAARAQFVHCPVFEEKRRRSYNETSRVKGRNDVCCCNEKFLELQRRVCHLCSHGCYLRAFAPLREWHYLRASVAELSEASPGMNHHFIALSMTQTVIY